MYRIHGSKKQLEAIQREMLKLEVPIELVYDEEVEEYNVNFRDGKEDTKYFTPDLDDAIGTARAMVEKYKTNANKTLQDKIPTTIGNYPLIDKLARLYVQGRLTDEEIWIINTALRVAARSWTAADSKQFGAFMKQEMDKIKELTK